MSAGLPQIDALAPLRGRRTWKLDAHRRPDQPAHGRFLGEDRARRLSESPPQIRVFWMEKKRGRPEEKHREVGKKPAYKRQLACGP